MPKVWTSSPLCLWLLAYMEAHVEIFLKIEWISWGTWVAQLFKHPTLDFGSGHDLRIVGSSPMSGSALGKETT